MRKLSLPVRILLAFISFLLGVALFAGVVVTALIADIQIVTSKDTIQSLVQELLSEPAHLRPVSPVIAGKGSVQIAHQMRNHQRIYRSEAENVADELTQQLIDMFYGQLVEQLGDQLPETFPDQQEFTQMIQDSTVKDYISDKTAGLITDYFNDTITTTFTPEEIVDLIEENAEIIESITGQPVPEDIAEQVGQIFDNNEIIQKVEMEGLAGFIDDPDLDIPFVQDIVGTGESFGVRDIINTLRTFASRQNLILGIVVCVVLIAAILLVNAAQLPKGLRRAGYPLLWAGLPVVVNVLALFVPDMWNVVPGLTVVQKLFQQTAIVNIIVFGTGFLLVLAGIISAIVVRVHSKIVEHLDEVAENREEAPVEIAAQVFDVTASTMIIDAAPAEPFVPAEVPVEEPEDDILARAAVFTEEPVEQSPVPEEAPAEETPAEETPTEETAE